MKKKVSERLLNEWFKNTSILNKVQTAKIQRFLKTNSMLDRWSNIQNIRIPRLYISEQYWTKLRGMLNSTNDWLNKIRNIKEVLKEKYLVHMDVKSTLGGYSTSKTSFRQTTCQKCLNPKWSLYSYLCFETI